MNSRQYHAVLLVLLALSCLTPSVQAYRDLETGTFVTRYPAGIVDGPNAYTYVRQNPWSKFDPLGLRHADPFPTPAELKMVPKQGLAYLQQQGKGSAATLAVLAAPVLALNAAATTPAGVAVTTDTAITVAETAAGIEGPGAIPNMGDMLRVPAQAALRNADEIVEATSKMLGSKSMRDTVEEVGETIAQLTPEQTAKLIKFDKKTPANATPAQVDQLCDGSVMFTAESAGKVPGSKKVYQKTVTP